MKSRLLTIALSLLSFAAGAAETDEAFALPAETLSQWNVPSRFAKLEGSVLTIDIPAANHPASAMATLRIDPKRLPAEGVTFTVKASAERLAQPERSYWGLKSQMHWRETRGGLEGWPSAKGVVGGFTNRTLVTCCPFNAARPDHIELQLGIQESSGRVSFDLSTLRFTRQTTPFSERNPTRLVRYPQRVTRDIRRRGVMLPVADPCEDDFRTLKEWGATLVRFQMSRNWGAHDDNQDVAEYARWVDGRLDVLERVVLPLAKKYGQKVVVDLHVAPGGRNVNGEMNMFFSPKFAEAFLDCWRRIATRFRGHADVIYGYDLINEPNQVDPSETDYWELQRRAAKAVRAIDPDTPVIVESNQWASPEAFAYLGALDLDNVIYQAHLYAPIQFTHQGVYGDPRGVRYPDEGKGWNRDYLKRVLEPVRAFERKHKAKIYIGEFSAISWAEGTDRYLEDCISIFKEYGWDWSYHAFREWSGWSVEHVETTERAFVPSADNPRKRALLRGLRD